jgi:hypothetical protein
VVENQPAPAVVEERRLVAESIKVQKIFAEEKKTTRDLKFKNKTMVVCLAYL